MFDLVLYKKEWITDLQFATCKEWFMGERFAEPRPALYLYNPHLAESDPFIVFKDKNEANAFYYQLTQTKKVSKAGNTYYNLDVVVEMYKDYKDSVGEEIESQFRL